LRRAACGAGRRRRRRAPASDVRVLRDEEIGVINPILTGVSTAAQALEALFASTPANPAGASAGTFSTGQGLPTGQGANPQTAPSNASNQFAAGALSFLTALQDPGSAAAGFVHGAETAIGQDVSGLESALQKLKTALTGGATGTSSAASSALSVGSAAAGALSSTGSSMVSALSQLTSALSGLEGGRHHGRHHHGGGGGASALGSTASASASALSLTSGASAAS
jgi:hypothetical protein